MGKLLLRSNRKKQLLPFDQIYCLISEGRYTTIYTKENSYLMCKNIGSILKDLPDCFIRTHHSYVVNLNKVVVLESQVISLSNNMDALISKRRLAIVKESFMSFYKLKEYGVL